MHYRLAAELSVSHKGECLLKVLVCVRAVTRCQRKTGGRRKETGDKEETEGHGPLEICILCSNSIHVC